MNNVSKNAKYIRWACTAALSIIAVFWLLPIAWILSNSLRTNMEFLSSYAHFEGPWEYIREVFPKDFTISSYVSLFTGEGMSTQTNMGRMISNSLIVSITKTLLSVTICSLSAYAYERLDFPAGDKIFWALFYIALIPSSASMLPLFKIANSFGWINSLNALIWPGCCGIMSIFMMRNFMKGIPKEMDEAATIDGAGSFRIYLEIILPSIKPVVMIQALSAFRGAWNEYLWPTIVLTDPTNQTLTSGLALLQNQLGGTQWTNLFASTIISMVLPLVLYLTCQKYFLKGISIQAAVKG